jgi:hypothetical protein
MSDAPPDQDRPAALARHLDRLLALLAALPDLAPEIRALAGAVAALGLQLRAHPGERAPLTLRRHEVVSIPETVTLLDHLAGLRSGGLAGLDLSAVRDILGTRTRALEAEIRTMEARILARIEPDLALDAAGLRLDGDRAISAFRGAPVTQAGQGRDADRPASALGLFPDHVAADLPEAERLEAARRIAARPEIARHDHDELLAIGKLRHIVAKVETYGFGVAARRRPLFSKARRAFLWGAPRVGLVMVTHLPSWRRLPGIGDVLLDVRRYEQHMKDLARIPEDDDFFCARDPLIRAVRADADRILRRSLEIVEEIRKSPSAFRFDAAFFNRLPGPQANQAPVFLERSAVIVNAMAAAGVGGKGERDRAFAHRAAPPPAPAPAGILTRIRKALA